MAHRAACNNTSRHHILSSSIPLSLVSFRYQYVGESAYASVLLQMLGMIVGRRQFLRGYRVVR